jgi:hypothetical protein
VKIPGFSRKTGLHPKKIKDKRDHPEKSYFIVKISGNLRQTRKKIVIQKKSKTKGINPENLFSRQIPGNLTRN